MEKSGSLSYFRVILLCLALSILFPQCKKEETPPDPPVFNSLEEEIDYMVGQYLKVGAVVGVIDKNQHKLILSYGTKKRNTDAPPDEHTVFEIGSTNKSFTCLIAAEYILKGILEDDTAQAYLPIHQVTLPEKDGVPITIYRSRTLV